MKLYTEEQVRHAIKMARSSYNIFTTPFMYDQDEVIEHLTPIELPSDEEIGKLRDEHIPIDEEDMWSERLYFTLGAKSMIDKIQGGNK